MFDRAAGVRQQGGRSRMMSGDCCWRLGRLALVLAADYGEFFLQRAGGTLARGFDTKPGCFVARNALCRGESVGQRILWNRKQVLPAYTTTFTQKK